VGVIEKALTVDSPGYGIEKLGQARQKGKQANSEKRKKKDTEKQVRSGDDSPQIRTVNDRPGIHLYSPQLTTNFAAIAVEAVKEKIAVRTHGEIRANIVANCHLIYRVAASRLVSNDDIGVKIQIVVEGCLSKNRNRSRNGI
jgi:hypothetical protein